MPGGAERDRSQGVAVQEPWYSADPWWHQRWPDLVVRLLGVGEVPFEQGPEHVTITLPPRPPTPYPHCLALEI